MVNPDICTLDIIVNWAARLAS